MDEIEKAWQEYLHRILIPPKENLKWLKWGFVDGYKYAQQSVHPIAAGEPAPGDNSESGGG